ncbi:MAG: CHAT domain-containing protein, partial [Verrucomicrobiota bacterium]
ELVILSACDTTHGTTPNFSALQGIPLALSAAGVKRAVVTRWCVDDQYTSGFMTRFYERLFASSEGSSIERVWDEHIAAEEARFDDLTRRRKLVAPFALITLN